MAVTDWLGLGSPFQGGSDSLNAPLLSYVSDDDPAADSSTSSSDTRDAAESESESESNPAADDDDDVAACPRDPRDANAAAAVLAVSQAPAQLEAARSRRSRRRRLERIRRQMRTVSRRVEDAVAAGDDVTQRLDLIPGGAGGRRRAADRVEDAATGSIGDDGEDSAREEEQEKETSDAATRAAMFGLVIVTAVLATYLSSMWGSLPPVVQFAVVMTYVWVYVATLVFFVRLRIDWAPSPQEADGVFEDDQGSWV